MTQSLFLEANEKLLSLRFSENAILLQDFYEKIQKIFSSDNPQEDFFILRKEDKIFLVEEPFQERLGFAVSNIGPIFGIQGTYIKKERFKILLDNWNETLQYSGFEGFVNYIKTLILNPEDDEFLGPTVITQHPIILDDESYKRYYIEHIEWNKEKLIIYDVNFINRDNLELLYKKIITYTQQQYKKETLIVVDIVTTKDGIGMLPHTLYKKLNGYGIYSNIKTAFIQVHNWGIDMVVRMCVKEGESYSVWDKL